MLTGILAAYCVKGVLTFNDSYSALRLVLSPDFNKDTCSGKSSTLIWLTLTSEMYNKDLPIDVHKANLVAFPAQPLKQCKL